MEDFDRTIKCGAKFQDSKFWKIDFLHNLDFQKMDVNISIFKSSFFSCFTIFDCLKTNYWIISLSGVIEEGGKGENLNDD